MSDGTVSNIDDERFRCAEALFQPSCIGNESIRIHDKSLQTNAMYSPYDAGTPSRRINSAAFTTAALPTGLVWRLIENHDGLMRIFLVQQR